MTLKSFLTLGFFMASVIPASPWGQKGHDTTAYIAECHLTPAAKKAVENLFDGKSIVYYSNWLDNASHTPEYAYSKTWHYKNIDDGIDYSDAPLNEKGDVERAIYDQVKILSDESSSREDKQLALKILVHLVGDIHQPMHMGHASDLGGNRWMVKYFGKDTNLHSIWDSSLPESAHKWSYTEWQREIDRASDDEISLILNQGNPTTWGAETYEIAKKVYKETPEESKISYDEVAYWTPVIEMQFLKGGLRLADLLNSIFDPSYSPKHSIEIK